MEDAVVLELAVIDVEVAVVVDMLCAPTMVAVRNTPAAMIESVPIIFNVFILHVYFLRPLYHAWI